MRLIGGPVGENLDLGGRNLTGDLFSIILFKNGGDYSTPNPVGSIFEDGLHSNPVGSILSTYKCAFTSGVLDGDINTYRRRCDFDYNMKNYPISEGDVIILRTENKKSIFLSFHIFDRVTSFRV